MLTMLGYCMTVLGIIMGDCMMHACSAGIHAAVMATCSPDTALLVARNCHLAAFSALVLSGDSPLTCLHGCACGMVANGCGTQSILIRVGHRSIYVKQDTENHNGLILVARLLSAYRSNASVDQTRMRQCSGYRGECHSASA